eukprot:scaffold301141_cov36-Prasinocladus_malaysianus.AAC.1
MGFKHLTTAAGLTSQERILNQTAYPAGRHSSGSSGSQMAFTIIDMMDESVSLRCALSRESASTQHQFATPLYVYV